MIKISFDDRSYEDNHNFDDFKENREMKDIIHNQKIINQLDQAIFGDYKKGIYSSVLWPIKL